MTQHSWTIIIRTVIVNVIVCHLALFYHIFGFISKMTNSRLSCEILFIHPSISSQTLHSLCVKYREDMVTLRVNSEHELEDARAKLNFLQGQLQTEQHTRTALEETYQVELEENRQELCKSWSKYDTLKWRGRNDLLWRVTQKAFFFFKWKLNERTRRKKAERCSLRTGIWINRQHPMTNCYWRLYQFAELP